MYKQTHKLEVHNLRPTETTDVNYSGNSGVEISSIARGKNGEFCQSLVEENREFSQSLMEKKNREYCPSVAE